MMAHIPCERTEEQDSFTELHVGGFGASSRKCVGRVASGGEVENAEPTIAGVSRESLEKHQIAAALRRGRGDSKFHVTFWSGCVPLKGSRTREGSYKRCMFLLLTVSLAQAPQPTCAQRPSSPPSSRTREGIPRIPSHQSAIKPSGLYLLMRYLAILQISTLLLQH